MSAVDKMVEAFGRFITRDLVYVVGGYIIIGSFCVFVGLGEKFLELDGPTLFLVAVAGYGTAFAAQEILSFFWIVRTGPVPRPGCVGRLIWNNLQAEEWKDIKGEASFEKYWMKIDGAGRWAQEFYMRVTFVKQISATFGASYLIGGLFFYLADGTFWPLNYTRDWRLIAFGIAGVTVGLILGRVCLSIKP